MERIKGEITMDKEQNYSCSLSGMYVKKSPGWQLHNLHKISMVVVLNGRLFRSLVMVLSGNACSFLMR